jgi:hypothetical protein
MQNAILAPLVALAAWSMVMWVWMYATRLPAFTKLSPEVVATAGMVPGSLDGVLPDKAQWKAHNYNHLMEQPTVFYAIVLALAVMGAGEGLNLLLAWGYVGFRIAHSLAQATVNKVPVRFALFALASLCLIGLVMQAALQLG